MDYLLGCGVPACVGAPEVYREAPAPADHRADAFLFVPVLIHQDIGLIAPQHRSGERSVKMVRVIENEHCGLSLQLFLHGSVHPLDLGSEQEVDYPGYHHLIEFSPKGLVQWIFLFILHYTLPSVPTGVSTY